MNRQLKEVLAMAMIGEGVIGLLNPRPHLSLWKIGPRRYRQFIEAMVQKPAVMRAVFAAEAALGIWLAERQLAQTASKRESGFFDRSMFSEKRTGWLQPSATE